MYFLQEDASLLSFQMCIRDSHNILKIAEEELAKSDDHKLFVLGELGRHYFEQKGINIDKQFHFVVQDPSLSRARRIAEDLLKLYHANELDELYIIYTCLLYTSRCV